MKNFICLALSFCFLQVGLCQSIDWKDDFSGSNEGWAKVLPGGPDFKIRDGELVVEKDVFTMFYLPIDLEKDFRFQIEVKEFGVFRFIVGADRWAQKDLDLSIDPTVGKKQVKVEIDLEDHHKIQKAIFQETKPLFFDPGEPSIISLERQAGLTTFTLEQNGVAAKLYKGALKLEHGESWFGFYGGNKGNKIIVDAISLKYEEYVPKGEITFEKGTLEKRKLGKEINTETDQIAPIVSPNGKRMWFGSVDKLYDQIYYAEIDGDSFGEVIQADKPINQSDRNNTLLNVSPDGNTIYISGYFEKGKFLKQGVSKVVKNSKGKWNKPEGIKIPGFVNEDRFSSYFITSDGNIMLLKMQVGSLRNGGDLYVCFRSSNGTFSKPKHLGDVINTPKTEATPFLAADLKTLYFSSEGHPGFGSSDLFVSKRLDDSWTNWSQPHNLGPDINTGDWEGYFSIPASGEHGYFTSYYTGYDRSADLFSVKLPLDARPDPVILVKGRVLDEKTKEPIGATITYRDLENDAELGTANSDPETGYFEIVLPDKREYSFYATADAYYSVRENIDLSTLKEYGEVERDLVLAPIAKGEAIRLNNVFFVRSKAVLMPKSLPELDKLAELLSDNPALEIQIEGHTDNTGSSDLNLELSQERAEKVREYLIEKGVDKKRLKAKGFGGAKAYADNKTEETRKLNRRVEFRIL